jgi:hypothetical protein
MEKQDGFKITRHAYDLPTAWSAVFISSAAKDDDAPTIGFNSEMDALKGMGHACGHNLIAIAGCASAIATARTLEQFKLPGRIILLGTPAEEGGGGKAVLLDRGAYKEMAACLMLHPGEGRGGKHGAGIMTSNCISGVSATFHGVPSHAGATPERAINALDAAFVAYSAISALRQQTPQGTKIHGIITGSEEWSPNGEECLRNLGLGCAETDRQPSNSHSVQGADGLRHPVSVGVQAGGSHSQGPALLRRCCDCDRMQTRPRARSPLPRSRAERPPRAYLRRSRQTVLGQSRRVVRDRPAHGHGREHRLRKRLVCVPRVAPHVQPPRSRSGRPPS